MEEQIQNNYKVIAVTTIQKREKLIKKLYSQLTAEPTTKFTIQQDQVNRIKVFHNTGSGARVLIRTYIVIVIPIIVDFAPLYSIYGNVDFYLDDVIENLSSIVEKLQKLKGHKVIRGTNNGKTLERELARLIR